MSLIATEYEDGKTTRNITLIDANGKPGDVLVVPLLALMHGSPLAKAKFDEFSRWYAELDVKGRAEVCTWLVQHLAHRYNWLYQRQLREETTGAVTTKTTISHRLEDGSIFTVTEEFHP